MIQCTVQQQIAFLQFNRPEKAHAYTQEMLLQIQTFFKDITDHCSIVVIHSKGHRAFCAGADLTEMKAKRAEDALDLLSQKVFQQIATSSCISIASIHGPAIAGGFELALACDLRVASKDAFFSLPEVSLGLIPSAGGSTRLTQLLGASVAKGMILGGGTVTGEEAFRWGLVHKLEEDPFLAAKNWAKELSERDPLALRLAKSVINQPSLKKERLAEAILYERKFGR
jgi:enoyl-CoA hydratase